VDRDEEHTEDRVLAQLIGCAYEHAGISTARRALDDVGLLDKDVLLDAALHLDTAPDDVRAQVYDLLAGVIGQLNADRRSQDA
jgi:hypothetical protein